MKYLALLLLALPCAAQDRTVYDARLAPATITMPHGRIDIVGGGQSAAVAAEPTDATLTNSWVSGGDAITVKTERSANETPEAQVARHVKMVKLMKTAFPSDVAHG